MARLGIVIREWRAEPIDEARYPALGADALVDMERRIKRLSRRDPTPGPPAGGLHEWITEFTDTFALELGTILDIDPATLTAPLEEPPLPDWNALFHAPDEDSQAFARFAADLLRTVLAEERTAQAPSSGNPPRDENEEPAEVAEAVQAGAETLEPSQVRDGLDDAEAWLKIIPPEYLGQGIVPDGVPRVLRTDPRVFAGWRRAIVTVRTVLSDFLDWASIRAGEGTHPPAGRIGRASLELTRALERATLYRMADVPGADLHVDVHAPLFLTVPPAGYDYDELHVKLIPSVGSRLNRIEFSADHRVRVHGETLVLESWSPHSSDDLARLADVLRRVLSSARRPEEHPGDAGTDERVVAALDGIGLLAVPGRPACWRKAGDLDVGLRPVFHYRHGTFQGVRFQLAVALGLDARTALPPDLLSQLVRHGEGRLWRDAGLMLLGRILESLDDLEEELGVFLPFAEEISINLRETGAVHSATEVDTTRRLATLPTRLDVDYERLRRVWHRNRQAERLRTLLRGVSTQQARTHVAGVRDEEDRNYLRSVLVTELFGLDPEQALAELRSIKPGPERHQSILAVLERAAAESRHDLAEKVFRLWKEADARTPHHDSPCNDILEIAAATLGRDAVLDGVPSDLDACVATDWLTLAFRTYPSVRGDLEWLRRLDALLLDERAVEGVGLDRLVALHDVLRRHGLPGRRRLLAAASGLVRENAFREYYESRLGVRLSDEEVARPTASDDPGRT
jgi:hypothetical protein